MLTQDSIVADLLKETQEQARLLGMSGERECDLRGKIQRLEKENLILKDLNIMLEKQNKTLSEMVEIFGKIEQIRQS